MVPLEDEPLPKKGAWTERKGYTSPAQYSTVQYGGVKGWSVFVVQPQMNHCLEAAGQRREGTVQTSILRDQSTVKERHTCDPFLNWEKKSFAKHFLLEPPHKLILEIFGVPEGCTRCGRESTEVVQQRNSHRVTVRLCNSNCVPKKEKKRKTLVH